MELIYYLANSNIKNISKKLSFRGKDIEILIDKLKQQKDVIGCLKEERDNLLNALNDLSIKKGGTKSEA